LPITLSPFFSPGESVTLFQSVLYEFLISQTVYSGKWAHPNAENEKAIPELTG